MMIDTGPLPSARAQVVQTLLEELVASNPQITGFLLHGSIWSPSTQLPESDVDINFTGSPEQGPAGEKLRTFEHLINGIRIELCSYIWGDVSQPHTLGLPTVVTLARSHILWERDQTLSGPRRLAKCLLRDDEAWVRTKIEQAIQSFGEMRTNWDNQQVLTAPVRGDWDLVRNILLHANGVTSAVDLRPPSHARKALFDTFECSRAIGIPAFAEQIAAAVGMADCTADEVTAWCQRIAADYQHARMARPQAMFCKADYNVLGALAMIERGCPAGALWPLWRAARECARQTEGLAGEHAEHCRSCFRQLGERLRLIEIADLKEKLSLLDRALSMLRQSVDMMTSHLRSRAGAVLD